MPLSLLTRDCIPGLDEDLILGSIVQEKYKDVMHFPWNDGIN